MIGNMINSSYSSNGGGLEPKPWWLIVFIVGFIVFEIIKWSFFR